MSLVDTHVGIMGELGAMTVGAVAVTGAVGVSMVTKIGEGISGIVEVTLGVKGSKPGTTEPVQGAM